ncbi:Fc.00g036030.m01.CDS01 [Cosmosporella sp. VM-42]
MWQLRQSFLSTPHPPYHLITSSRATHRHTLASFVMAVAKYSAQTTEELRVLAEQWNNLHGTMKAKDLKTRPTQWNIQHLIAYRLLVASSDDSFLETLRHDHPQLCPLCSDVGGCPQDLDLEMTEKFLHEEPHGFRRQTSRDLLLQPDGGFWLSLAASIRQDLGAGLTPSQCASKLRHEDNMNQKDVDQESHNERRARDDELSLRLARDFLTYALHLCLRPEGNQVYGVTTSTHGDLQREKVRDDCWLIAHPYLALLESKRSFKEFTMNEANNSFMPVVSNESLAQLLGEAVAIWSHNPEFVKDSVFMIVATNTFIRFIHFRFGNDYREYFNTPDAAKKLELIGNNEKDTCVHMNGTKWFNLRDKEDRKGALCHIFALLRWHDAHTYASE